MSNVEKLLQKYCPKGVEFKTLGELGSFYGGLTGKSKKDFVDGNAVFITYRNVYSNPVLDVHPSDKVKISEGEKQRTLEYGDIVFTGSSETPDECGLSSVVAEEPDDRLYLNSFCFFFRFNNPKIMSPDFAKHLFRSDNLRYQIRKTASGVTRFNVSKEKMAKVSIPVPPLEVQREIVCILDSFTGLIANLTAELTARKKQYEHYRDLLLSCDGSFPKVKLSEIGTFTRGKRFVKADAVDEGVPCIHYGELYTFYGVWADKPKSHVREDLRGKLRYAEENDVVIVGAGENDWDIGVGVAWLGKEKVAVHDACYIFKHSMNPKYISYCLRTVSYHRQIKKYVSTGKICAISADGLGQAVISLPPIETQNKIVDILDHFDTLCNDLSAGLPAEIEARQKQYEYYRDKLLSFNT